MAFKDKTVLEMRGKCFELRLPHELYPVCEIAVCVVTGKQIAEHHDMVCETPAWAIAYLKKKTLMGRIITTKSASSRHDEGILA